MSLRIHPSWQTALAAEFVSPYWEELTSFVRGEYSRTPCFPVPANIFRAYDLTPFDRVRVVILGQDPYHTPGAAMGLSFSVPNGSKMQPSLRNIFKELESDLWIKRHTIIETTQKRGDLRENRAPEWSVRSDGTVNEEAEIWTQRSSFSGVSTDLTDWAEQGVLLLNAVLTVRSGEAASHAGKGWERFTDATIRTLSEWHEHLVFILWGNYALGKAPLIDQSKHLVLSSAHPSPFSADRGFFGSRPFSKTNEALKKCGYSEIKWG